MFRNIVQVKNNLIKTKKKDDPSGSRTLLRLHRALEYITEFLGHLESLEDETYLGAVSREAYEKTLMKYHPWIVQVKTFFLTFHVESISSCLESSQDGHGTFTNQERIDSESSS